MPRTSVRKPIIAACFGGAFTLKRFWISERCGKREPFEDDPADYAVGDVEPCLCGDLKCAAVVTEIPV